MANLMTSNRFCTDLPPAATANFQFGGEIFIDKKAKNWLIFLIGDLNIIIGIYLISFYHVRINLVRNIKGESRRRVMVGICTGGKSARVGI